MSPVKLSREVSAASRESSDQSGLICHAWLTNASPRVFLDAQVRIGHGDRRGTGAVVEREIEFAIERVHRRFGAELEAADAEVARKRAARDGLAAVLAQRLRELRVLDIGGVEVRGDDVAHVPLARRERGERHVPPRQPAV